jgi:predicted AAA+ superfamily ATPase
MPLTDQHVQDNPWWSDPTAIDADYHLAQLQAQPLVSQHSIPFDLHTDAVYTIRGPRQVGKTTFLKRIVRRLLTEEQVKPRRILYADVGGMGLEDHSSLADFVASFSDYVRERNKEDRVFVLLDEVTGVSDWGVAIRTLHGRGKLQHMTVIATGSHALDVKRGGERAPGRRGDVDYWDWIMMPLSFRDYVALHDPTLIERVPALQSLDPYTVFETSEEVHFVGAAIERMFDRYLLTGGYPYAVSAEHEHEQIPHHIYRLYRDAIRGELARTGLNERYFRELISWAGHKRLGQEFSWRNASDETGIGSKDTARKYLEAAEGLFLWHIYYRVLDPTAPREALKSPKKLFPADPFGWHVLASWVRGERQPWSASIDRLNDPSTRGDLVESVCADHFRRRFGHFAFYFRDKKGRREIDFALFEDASPRALVEVKYRARNRKKHRQTLTRQGGGILATRNHLEWYPDDGVAAVPVCYLLASLPWEISLFPERE